MTNPDAPPPVQLLLHDLTEQDMVDAAVAALQLKRPAWQPAEADIEVQLIESNAILTGQYLYALNRLPAITLANVMALYGIGKQPATPATGQVAVVMASPTGGSKTVPAGTRFRVQMDDGTSFDAAAVGAVTGNPTDSMTIHVPVVCSTPGAGPNGTPAGTPVMTVDSLSWVETAATEGVFVGGTDLEPDAAYFARSSAFLQRQSMSLVTATQMQYAALEVPGVGRAKAFNLWNGTGSSATVAPGHVTLAVATAAGGPCSSVAKTAVLAALQAGSVAGLTFHVVDPTVVAVSLTVNISVAAGYTPSVVQAAAQTAVQTYLDPAGRPWGAGLRTNELIGVVAKVPGVDIVNSVSGAPIGGTPAATDLPTTTPTITVTIT